MDVDPVDFTLCLGVVLLYRLAIHLGFILADGLADGCPAAHQRLSLHGSCTSFGKEHGRAAGIAADAVVVGEMIAAVFLYSFLVLDIVTVY